jgi:hypothetical protein
MYCGLHFQFIISREISCILYQWSNTYHFCDGYGETYIWSYKPAPFIIIVIYATSFCGNWASLIARGARLKHEHSEGFKASRAIRKAQFTQKRVAYKILLLETTSNFSRPVRHVTLNVLSRATIRYLLLFALGQLRGSLQRRKMKIYDS